MSSALRVRYTIDDSMKAMEARYLGCPPFAEGKHPSLHCHGRAAASRHTQLLSAFPAGWVRHCCVRETSADKCKRCRNYVSYQSAGSAERWSWCLAQAVTWCLWLRSPHGAEGKLGRGVVGCCNSIWQGKLQEKTVLSRGTSSCTVVLSPWAVCFSSRNCFPFSSLCFVIFPAIDFAAESSDCL